MRKAVILLVLTAVCLIALAGCKDDDPNIYSEASYDSVSEFVPDSVSREETENSNSLTGEFVVKEKKYTYEGNDLVVVSVENNTNKNYAVTITGTYLDAENKVLKTETQTFDQYSAGYVNNFIFVPQVEFESYTYTIETEEAEGPFYAKHVTSAFRGLEMIDGYIMSECEKGNWETYPSVVGFFSFGYDCETTVKSYSRWLLINEQNQAIYWEDYISWLDYGQVAGDGWGMTYVYQTTDRSYQMPEKWQGNIKAIVSITALTTEPKPAPPSSTN